MYCKDDFAADHTENHLDALPKLFDFDDVLNISSHQKTQIISIRQLYN